LTFRQFSNSNFIRLPSIHVLHDKRPGSQFTSFNPMSIAIEGDGSAGEPPVTPARGKAPTVEVTSLEAYEALTARFGTDMSFPKLIRLAEAVQSASEVGAPIRDEARTTDSLYRWFHQNWAAITSTLDSIELEDSQKEE
jgi:hypothetical protein